MKKGSNKEVTCLESECIEDSHCDADRKCCKNRCGGMVCTQAGMSMFFLATRKLTVKIESQTKHF